MLTFDTRLALVLELLIARMAEIPYWLPTSSRGTAGGGLVGGLTVFEIGVDVPGVAVGVFVKFCAVGYEVSMRG